jgi:N-acetylmuramoyl-L-alanine amidase
MPYQYKWWLYDGATWRIARDWAAGNTFAWTPVTAGASYQIGVSVRSAGNTSGEAEAWASMPYAIRASASVTAVAITADKPSPQRPGTTIRFTATPAGGVAPYQYKWLIYNGSSWTVARTWSTSNTFAWTPTTVRTYFIAVYVRSAWDTRDTYEAARAVAYAIQGPSVTSVTITADKPSPQHPGTAITFTATPLGGQAPYQFEWSVYDGSAWHVTQKWSTANRCAWTPTTISAAYVVRVYVRSAWDTATAPEASTGIPYPIR